MIERVPGWSVCGEATTGRQAVQLAETVAPDIVVLDMVMPELNGLEAAREIKRRLPETEMLLYTGGRSEDLVKAAFEAGARSFLSKTDTGHFVPALEALGNHKNWRREGPPACLRVESNEHERQLFSTVNWLVQRGNKMMLIVKH